jgi:hypothetical protein
MTFIRFMQEAWTEAPVITTSTSDDNSNDIS